MNPVPFRALRLIRLRVEGFGLRVYDPEPLRD